MCIKTEKKNLITSYKVFVHLKMMIHTHAYIFYMLYMLYVYCINYLWNEWVNNIIKNSLWH